MGKGKKRKKNKTIFINKGHAFADSFLKSTAEDFKLAEDDDDDEADHVIDGYKIHHVDHNQYFNDDLGIDEQDYEVEQEKYGMESEDAQPIAVDRYFKRLGKSRRTPR